MSVLPVGMGSSGGYEISRSVRLRSSASAYLNRTPASTTNRRTYTFSVWVKRGIISADQYIFAADNGTLYTNGFFSSDYLMFNHVPNTGGTVYRWRTPAVFRDPSAWYHIVYSIDTTQATASNRIRIYVNGVEQTSLVDVTGYGAIPQNTDTHINTNVSHMIGRFIRGSNNQIDGYITEFNFIDGQALTASSFGETDAVTGVWKPKKYAGTYGTNGFYLPFTNTATVGGNGFSYSEDFSNAAWTKYQSTITANATTAPNGTTTADKLIETATTGDHQTYRTFSATDNTAYTWSAYAKAAERSNFRMYLQNKAGSYNYADFDLSNGTIGTQSGVTAVITSVGSGWYRCSVSCNAGTGATASPLAILSYATVSAGSGTNGLYIWGAQLEGSTSVAGAYYTTTSSGFGTYQIGADQSLATGGYNSWVANNISLTAGVTYDSMLDVPTAYADGGNGRGNYATLNPLQDGVTATYSNANLTAAQTTPRGVLATIGVTTGKWYWEITNDNGAGNLMVGIANITVGRGASGIWYPTTGGYCYFATTGNKWNNNTGTAYGATYTTGDVIGVALDLDGGTLTFYKNGASQGTAFTGLNNGNTYMALIETSVATSVQTTANFGQRPFTYTPPTGFKALNTQNLPESTIKKGSLYFDAKTYSGTGGTQSITNASGFAPDLAWIKMRSTTGENYVWDTVRGGGSALDLVTNRTNAEGFNSAYHNLAFTSSGFDITQIGVGNEVNASGQTYVAWQWKKSVSAGFDIVTYTGTGVARTVAHSLGVAPKMVIVKRRNGSVDYWDVLHQSANNGSGHLGALFLQRTDAWTSSSSEWNNTAPTSSVFSVGTSSSSNANGGTYVAYLFAEVAGYSAFGKYTGNGSADGAFVYLGFRPKWIMVKDTTSSSAGAHWFIWDSSRNTYNLANNELIANSNVAENVADGSAVIDVLSNGFKFRANTYGNISGATNIYAAFAENPFKNSLAR